MPDNYMPGGNMSNEQFASRLAMDDLSTEEKQLLLQQAQTQQLRAAGMQPSAKRDFGSQGARALQGIGGAIGTYQDKQAMDAFSLKKANVAEDQRRLLLGQPPVDRSPMGPPQPLPESGDYGNNM